MSQPAQASKPTPIFDREALLKRRKRALSMPNDHRFLHDWVSAQITERLSVIKRDFQNRFNITIQNDPFDDSEILQTTNVPFDLITSNLTLHTINDLPGALIQIKRALNPDGLFIGALLGGETLTELRQSITHTEMYLKGGISPRIFPMADKQDIGALMQRAGYALPVIDSERVTVTYKSLSALIDDLRGMAETNIIRARNTSYIGRDFMNEIETHYQNNFSEPDGTLTATFDIIFMLGWAPHESQPKPLQRGSAKTSLKDVL